ncbi:hypothetical protein GJU40_05270 [Bacillus lacus]|uniref:Uncharacterized protein n=1 Tax=Metabacillus lacus TaxID=1983721 RepID=A0A7X2LXR9_9BACI|nr:hypothetical protein [Metabacillus lacus]MRX71586.1 hypothetical protein [Metabacillus lacus]
MIDKALLKKLIKMINKKKTSGINDEMIQLLKKAGFQQADSLSLLETLTEQLGSLSKQEGDNADLFAKLKDIFPKAAILDGKKQKNPSIDYQKLYDMLKVLGFQAEKGANDWLQHMMNSKDFASCLHMATQIYDYLLSRIKEYHEIAAAQLNIPTKNDIANLGEMIIATEEKVDQLQDVIEELNNHMISEKKSADIPASREASEGEEELLKRIQKLENDLAYVKRMMKLSFIKGF